MAASEDRLPALLERIERREQSARRRAVLYSILPVALAVALLSYTAWQVQRAQRQVQALNVEASTYTTQIADLKREADGYKAQAKSFREQATRFEEQAGRYKQDVERLQTQLADAKRKLAAATDLSQYVYLLDFVDAKSLASRFPGSERLLIEILRLRDRGTTWKLGGQSPEEGFDSPSFAMYILRRTHALGIEPRPGESLLSASRRLFESLPPTNRPQTGDLAFYPSGYALFYFDDRRERPFVLGMTPFGITALKADFAQVIGYRRVRRN